MRSSDETVAGASRHIRLAKVGEQLLEVELAVILVDLWDFLLQFVLISLRETAHNEEFADASLLLSLNKFKYSVDALLFCVLDKSACVNHHNLTVDALSIVSAMIASLLKHRHQSL